MSWYVSYSFERPIAEWKDLGPALAQALADGRRNGLDELEDVEILRGFRVSMQRSGMPWPNAFVLGAWSDYNSGGFVVSELERNLRLCIAEKTEKVASVRHKYVEWWLLFLDHIGYGGDREELLALGDSAHVGPRGLDIAARPNAGLRSAASGDATTLA